MKNGEKLLKIFIYILKTIKIFAYHLPSLLIKKNNRIGFHPTLVKEKAIDIYTLDLIGKWWMKFFDSTANFDASQSVQFLKKSGNKYKNWCIETLYFSLHLKIICVYLCFGILIFYLNECLILIRCYYFGTVKYL